MIKNVVLSISDVLKILRPECGWYKPDMESKQHILDIRLTNYPYIVVRFTTGISKASGETHFGKVFAVNLRSRRGWVKSVPIHYYGNWQDFLIESCRKRWNMAVARAKKEGLERMTLEEYELRVQQ